MAPAVSSAAGFMGSGGVTLYKSAKETGPKVEFVLIKVEMNHSVYQPPTPTPPTCKKCQ